ncbi:MAG: photosynthetic reaction center cytochrome PufC [Pseudomonadota bacterium]
MDLLRTTVIRAAALGTVLFGVTACGERPPVDSEQIGFRGTAMVTVTNPRIEQASLEVPAVQAAASQAGPRAGDIYQNVEVLGDLSIGEFTRTMLAITEWVAPEQGCNYCHYPENLADDGKYTKIVSRRMFQMTQHINQNWTDHVGGVGVTCYTCHRGNNVPENIWFAQNPEGYKPKGYAGNTYGQNMASEQAVYTSLPGDAMSAFLMGGYDDIRVVNTSPSAAYETGTIKDTEWTYSLMMHMSDSLGVNCTFCHNSRGFASWAESPPQRVTAWYGIRMVSGLNTEYLDPLQPVYPDNRLGPHGDAPKAYCSTCHAGQNKPLGGANMINDYLPAMAGRDYD